MAHKHQKELSLAFLSHLKVKKMMKIRIETPFLTAPPEIKKCPLMAEIILVLNLSRKNLGGENYPPPTKLMKNK